MVRLLFSDGHQQNVVQSLSVRWSQIDHDHVAHPEVVIVMERADRVVDAEPIVIEEEANVHAVDG